MFGNKIKETRYLWSFLYFLSSNHENDRATKYYSDSFRDYKKLKMGRIGQLLIYTNLELVISINQYDISY